ncbi:hypothetical protein BO94DRAFT_533221 [Aspergillus sclerotioniger CBS 115572]|uniref:Protamine P1 n=1 Tax=Aspergillus sclerotioniger CBS 115572 TaxID=1450535 RepID=A0A317X0G2_9EURO|nr:hypothetical protein BO94DRAFT_533221 [Aspergillus sclerotioniger CBS 115572]PWY91765.1 hypothetical protein BO94DRAFT_533221 [Aspergillus sclerotioniger CBS 115572]
MPPRHPVSPLSLETISPSPPNLDTDSLVASDDDLDDNDRAARDQRIEKLAQAYLHGTPLFILSASLRGPLDNSWANPWRKDRQRVAGSGRKGGGESAQLERPVIPGTIPRKRPLYRDPSDISRTKSAVPSSNPPYPSAEQKPHENAARGPLLKRPRDSRGETPSFSGTTKRTIQYKKAIGASGQLDTLTPLQHTDQSWLRKDRAGIDFRKVDPPTSPTATILSRHRDERHYTIQVPGTDYRVTTRTLLRTRTNSRDDTTFDSHVPDSVKSQLTSRNLRAQPVIRGSVSDSEHQQNSLCVDTSTSHLPKFEYRRGKRSAQTENDATSPDSEYTENDQVPDKAISAKDGQTSSQHVPIPPSTTSMQAIEAEMSRTESNLHSLHVNVSKNSDRTDHQASSQSRKLRSTNNAAGANVSDRLPSAQQVSVNPAMAEHVTSLHTISALKPNSECDNDTIPDLHFNTQAALLHAQKSFQNDLKSQEHNQGEAFNQPSSPANYITPFHRMNISDRIGRYSRAKPPGTARLPMSTQCIIDAVTPFTFSTEKARPQFISPQEPMSSRMEPGSVGTDTASSSSSEHDEDGDPTILPLDPPAQEDIPGDSQGSPLPIILSGTNPTTFEDGQGLAPGADSFNLNQAIADAGSWLQQSFEINNEIQQCRSAKSRPSSSAGLGRSAVHLDT